MSKYIVLTEDNYGGAYLIANSYEDAQHYADTMTDMDYMIKEVAIGKTLLLANKRYGTISTDTGKEHNGLFDSADEAAAYAQKKRLDCITITI